MARVQHRGLYRHALLWRLARSRTRIVGDPGGQAMNDRDRPSNPFGRGDRTVIRPNPGGRLPTAPTPPPAYQPPQQPPGVVSYPQPPAGSPLPTPPGAYPSATPPPLPPAQPGHQPAQA